MASRWTSGNPACERGMLCGLRWLGRSRSRENLGAFTAMWSRQAMLYPDALRRHTGRTEAGGDGAVRSPGHRPGDSLCYIFLRSNESPYVNATLFFNGLRFCGIVGSRQLKCGLLRSRSRSGHRIVIRVSLLHELRRRPNRWIFSVLIILLVEQNARRALAASQRAYVLEQGRIAFSGSNRDARRPRVIAHYLGV
jgi:hypothetical protein